MEVEFDKEDQLQCVLACVLPSEILFGVYDVVGSGPAFVGITDKRLMLGFRVGGWGKVATLESLPYSRIKSVACNVSLRPPFTIDKVLVFVTGEHEFHVLDLKPTEKARRVYATIMGQLLQA